jgi:hypothetical protein
MLRFKDSRNRRFHGFKGQYQDSRKSPEFAVDFMNPQGSVGVNFVLEVGVAETYDDLVENAKLWLEGMDTVSLVMLVKFVETPNY